MAKDGGPAFPTETATVYDHDADISRHVSALRGMALRDWFAGQALALAALLPAPRKCSGATTRGTWQGTATNWPTRCLPSGRSAMRNRDEPASPPTLYVQPIRPHQARGGGDRCDAGIIGGQN